MIYTESIQMIYEKIQDEQSKMIYINRLNYSLTKDYYYIQNIVNNTVRKQPLWKQFCEYLIEKNARKEMVIFGSGIWGNILYTETRSFIPWKYVVDSSPKNKKTGNLPVLSFEDFVSGYTGEWVVISSYKNYQEMKGQLLQRGIPDEKILNAGNIIYELTEKIIYFDLKELLPHNGKEIFVDAGGFDGKTTKQFLDWGGENSYSYCFEPDDQNIKEAIRNLEGYMAYEIVPKALWSKTTELAIQAKGNFATHVGEKSDSNEKIDAVALDDFLMGKPVTYLKMDVEGAELEALRGAKQLVASQKPRLAISIYHKAEDIWTLPKYILEICPDYKFFLKHYSFGDYDTVLYAIPS